jgi:hypothetical protein
MNARRFAQACSSACSSRSRPIRRGGRSRLAGAVARRAGRVLPPRSIVASSSIVSAEGRAELVLQALLEALEDGDRRGPVAAQVVQAHQPALAVRPAGRSDRRCA